MQAFTLVTQKWATKYQLSVLYLSFQENIAFLVLYEKNFAFPKIRFLYYSPISFSKQQTLRHVNSRVKTSNVSLNVHELLFNRCMVFGVPYSFCTPIIIDNRHSCFSLLTKWITAALLQAFLSSVLLEIHTELQVWQLAKSNH
jgi:hypothetical protein